MEIYVRERSVLRTLLIELVRGHYIEQALIAVHVVVHNIVGGYFVEQLSCAGNLRFLNRSDVKRVHRAFGFGYEENVLYRALMERYRPVGGVVANGGWD